MLIDRRADNQNEDLILSQARTVKAKGKVARCQDLFQELGSALLQEWHFSPLHPGNNFFVDVVDCYLVAAVSQKQRQR